MRPAVVVVLAFALAGCGSDADPAADYREAADEICATANENARAVPAPGDSAEALLPYIDAILEIRRDEADGLTGLAPPDDLRVAHDELVTASERILSALETVRAAAAQQNRQAATLGSQQGDRARQDALAAARELGLESCGRPL